MRYPTALTIAGSDSSGGAGLQADLKTFAALGVYGTSVLTAVTAQNTRQVRVVEPLPAALVRSQLEAVLDDMEVDAVKTGMLVSGETIEVVAEAADKYSLKHLVVDPVMTATAGTSLSCEGVADALRSHLYSRLTLLTPNIPEAELLTGLTIRTPEDVLAAGECLLAQGCRAVLIKGGHLTDGATSVDQLFQPGKAPQRFSSAFIATANLHGTGCTLASAVTAQLALGQPLPMAVRHAKHYIAQAIHAGAAANFKGGNGPLNHFFDPQPLKPIV